MFAVNVLKNGVVVGRAEDLEAARRLKRRLGADRLSLVPVRAGATP